jgi:hypothetical protein
VVAPAWDFEAWEDEVAEPVVVDWQPRSEPSPSPPDGILGIYALRLLDREVDPRRLVNESRVSRLLLVAPPLPTPTMERRVGTPIAFGRGTAEHPLGRRPARLGFVAQRDSYRGDRRNTRPLSQRYRRLFGPIPIVSVARRRVATR